jgi:RimJ/RimL family protein N-acetyltransferase
MTGSARPIWAQLTSAAPLNFNVVILEIRAVSLRGRGPEGSMTEYGTVRLRVAGAEDRFLIRRWLGDRELALWWGNAASAEAQINLAMSSQLALCRIIEVESRPLGYVHAEEIGLWSEERPPELAPGTWHIGYFVPSTEREGPGLAAAVLAMLAAEVFATTLAVACSGVVSIRNEAGARAYERAGFRWQRIWHDRLLGPSWLMLRERPQ